MATTIKTTNHMSKETDKIAELETENIKLVKENNDLKRRLNIGWWIDKEISELPQYLKTKHDKVFKVKRYVSGGKYFYARLYDYSASLPVKSLRPATQSEYENQKLQTT